MAQAAEGRPESRPADARAPDKPTGLGGRAWFGVLKRTARESRADNLTDWAAALTYYGVLALFPALIVLLSILGLVGHSATQPLLDNLSKLAPGSANQIIGDAVRQIANSRGTAGVAFIVGLLVALWSASGYVGAFARASNAIYDVEEGRPFWIMRPVQILVTVAMILLLAASALAVVVSGPLARQVGKLLGVGSSAVTAWDIAKWPAILLVVITMIAILYFVAPNVKHQGFRWITPGGMLSVLIWLIASAAFAFYVANFGSYNKTYGALAGVVVFLVWLWISNLAILLGAEFNAELERGRELAAGQPAEDELRVTPRAAKT